MNFELWFKTFLDEKEIDMSELMRDEIQVGDVCMAILNTTPAEQKKIKDTLVMIDFKNGDVYHYFRHLAQALNKEDVERMRLALAKEIVNINPYPKWKKEK